MKENLATEPEGKLVFLLFLALLMLPELMAGKEGLSGVPRVAAEILALISQTCKPSVDSSCTGSTGRGMPWGLSLLLWPGMALWSIDVPSPSPAPELVPRRHSHTARLALGMCPELGDVQERESLAKPKSPPAVSHSRPVCPVHSRPLWCHQHHPTASAPRLENWRNFL